MIHIKPFETKCWKKKLTYEYKTMVEWEGIANKDSWKEVKEIQKALDGQDPIEQLPRQKRGAEEEITDVEIDQDEQDHHPKKAIIQSQEAS